MWKPGGTDRSYLAILHNGEVAYASNAGKLNGLAPEAYIQPQDSLLDNGYLKINQQTKKEYTKAGHTVDRWFFSGGTKVTVLPDCIRLTASANSPIYFAQLLEETLGSGVYTMAILLKNASRGALLASNEGHNTYYANKIFSDIGEDLKLVTATFEVPKNNTLKRAYVRIDEASADLAAFKLEPGPYFTGWPVWNYALELARCQRYQIEFVHPVTNISTTSNRYGVIGGGTPMSATRASILCSTPVQIRTVPVMSFSGKFVLRAGSASASKGIPVANIASGTNAASNGINIMCDVSTDTPLTIGAYYELWYLPNNDGNSLLANANL